MLTFFAAFIKNVQSGKVLPAAVSHSGAGAVEDDEAQLCKRRRVLPQNERAFHPDHQNERDQAWLVGNMIFVLLK